MAYPGGSHAVADKSNATCEGSDEGEAADQTRHDEHDVARLIDGPGNAHAHNHGDQLTTNATTSSLKCRSARR